MPEYDRFIDESFDLPQIETQIRFEEDGFNQFLKSTVALDGGVNSNQARYSQLPINQKPKLLSLAKASLGTPVPAGKTVAWSGIMIVKGTPTNITAYRDK